MSVSPAQAAKHSAKSVEWYTPPEVIAAAKAVMGDIRLDPCSCAEANKYVGALTWRVRIGASPLPEEVPWVSDSVWLNPPGGCYGKDGLPTKAGASVAHAWWRRLTDEYARGNVKTAMFMGFSLDILQTSQAAFPSVADFPVCVPSSRLRFISGETGLPEKSPTHANVIVYLPPLADDWQAGLARFARAFKPIGKVLCPDFYVPS